MLISGRLLIDPSREPQLGWLRVRDGQIIEIGQGPAPDQAGADGAPRVLGGHECLISPAFYDAHTHLPQTDAVGCDGMELLRWLDTVVFPAEAWWGRGMALSMAQTATRRMAQEGTAGFAGYLTSHGAVNHEVIQWLCAHTRQRFIVGRVAMDREAPDELTREDRERTKMQSAPSPILPELAHGAAEMRGCSVSANPRFAIACTEELLAEVGWAVKEGAASRASRPWVQTHLSESLSEVAYVKELFPDDAHYTGVYDRLGLLTDRTLLAHCVHVTPAEWELIAKRGSTVVHCPTANTFLQSGLFDLEAAKEHRVKLALGSDVAGGPDYAMPRVARGMIEVAKTRKMVAPAEQAERLHIPSPAEAWALITQGNAEALGWEKCGKLEVGAAADLLVMRLPVTWYDEHLVGRLIYNWRSGLIQSRVFAGEVVEPGVQV